MEQTKYETKEQKMQAGEMMTDIQALLNEFYVGNAQKDGNDLILTLQNGQRFSISVQEL